LEATVETYTPIRSVVLFLQVPLQPTVGVRLPIGQLVCLIFIVWTFRNQTYGVQEVQLTPFQRSRRPVGGIGCTRLHAPDMPDVLDVVSRSIAAIAGETARYIGGGGQKTGDEVEALHSDRRCNDKIRSA
jgi:hypothetical protein